MDILDNRQFRIHRYLLQFTGQWPYQSSKERRIRWILFYMIIGTTTIAQVLKIIQLWDNIDALFECLVPFGANMLSFLKSSNGILNNAKLQRILDLMKDDWKGMRDEKEVEILTRYVERGGYILSIYGVCCFGSIITYLSFPLMPQILDFFSPLNETRPRRLLSPVEYYVDPNEYYTYIMIHAYAGMLLSVIICISADIMLVNCVHHLCGFFTIVGNRFKNTMQSVKIDAKSDGIVESDKVYKYVANCINDHRRSIEFAQLIETSYQLTILFQIAIDVFVICATGLQIVAKLDKFSELIRYSQSLITQLIHLLFSSWPSQMLIDHSEQFYDSLYFSEWHQFPLAARHLLRLAMLKSIQPCKMTAGKFYDLSLANFAKVVQTSMSYLTVLVSLR